MLICKEEKKKMRRGIGFGLGKGYKNMLPNDKLIHGLSALGIKTQFNKKYREYNKINKKFDKLWKEPDTPKRSAKFKKVREEELYPLYEQIAKIREKNPPELNWDYTDVPVVQMAVNGEGGNIVWMSPDDFMYLAQPQTNENEYEYLHLSSVKWLVNHVDKENEMPVGFLEYDGDKDKIYGHEGRHRAFVCKMLGVKKMPVAIVGEGSEKFNIHITSPDWNTRLNALGEPDAIYKSLQKTLAEKRAEKERQDAMFGSRRVLDAKSQILSPEEYNKLFADDYGVNEVSFATTRVHPDGNAFIYVKDTGNVDRNKRLLKHEREELKLFNKLTEAGLDSSIADELAHNLNPIKVKGVMEKYPLDPTT